MELSNALSYIPRLAGGLLVLIGVLIAFEIYIMVRPKKIDKDEEAKSLQPDQMQPLQFSTQAPKPIKKSTLPNIPVSQKAIIITIILLIILTLSLLAIHYVFVLRGAFPNLINSPDQTPTEELPKPRPVIRVFQVDPQGTWNQLTEQELKKLLKGEEIYISVDYPLDIHSIEFVINGEAFVGDTSQLSPKNNPYILYTIPEDKQNFYIEVYVD